MSGEPTITLLARCLCGTHTFPTTLPVSSLPLKVSACHCISCRHVTGALRSSDAVWPGPASDIADALREFEAMQKKGEELPFFVDPATHKLLASQDCCASCRIWSGSEVYNWTFSLLRHISIAGADASEFPSSTAELRAAVEGKDGKPRDPRFGTLTFYASSPDVQRYHCGRCSASVFYAVDSRPSMVDIAVGVLNSPDGARAESVLSWAFGEAFSWKQDMEGTWREGILHAVERDLEQWRIERGYPKNWHRVAREKAAREKAAQAEQK
ncbi:hypothetical protein N0V88_002172 [Collariella sp. IMI 366227]|nr:hypothetical protein N0V88_002172 [Collariella sp. IMI 366227]